MTSVLRMFRESPVFVTGAILGTVLAAADLVGGETPGRAAIAFGIVIAWALLVTVLSRRSEVFSVLAGRPVDERWEQINLQAAAGALGASALAVLLGVAVAEVRGGDPMPYALVGVVMAISYVGAIAWLRFRG